MGLDVTSKRYFTMLGVVELTASHDASRADVARDTSLWGKSIDPHGGEINQLNQHQCWNELERERVASSADSFFDHSDLSFDLGDMLIC